MKITRVLWLLAIFAVVLGCSAFFQSMNAIGNIEMIGRDWRPYGDSGQAIDFVPILDNSRPELRLSVRGKSDIGSEFTGGMTDLNDGTGHAQFFSVYGVPSTSKWPEGVYVRSFGTGNKNATRVCFLLSDDRALSIPICAYRDGRVVIEGDLIVKGKITQQ